MKLTINGKEVEAPKGSTVLQAAEKAGIEIPRLCYDPHLKNLGACRLCIVEVKGNRLLPLPASHTATDGMIVETERDAVVRRANEFLSFW